MTTPEVWDEHVAGYIMASRAASWIGGAGNDGQAAHPRRASSRRTATTVVRSQGGTSGGRKLIAPPYGMYEGPPVRAGLPRRPRAAPVPGVGGCRPARGEQRGLRRGCAAAGRGSRLRCRGAPKPRCAARSRSDGAHGLQEPENASQKVRASGRDPDASGKETDDHEPELGRSGESGRRSLVSGHRGRVSQDIQDSGGAWNGSWNGAAGIPAQPVLSVRLCVSSLLLVRAVQDAVVMVMRRAVRFVLPLRPNSGQARGMR